MVEDIQVYKDFYHLNSCVRSGCEKPLCHIVHVSNIQGKKGETEGLTFKPNRQTTTKSQVIVPF